MAQSSVRADTRKLETCLNECFPTFSNIFHELIQIESVRLVGPFMLFAFLNDIPACKEFPLHIQATSRDLAAVKSLLQSLPLQQMSPKDTLNRYLYESKTNVFKEDVMIDDRSIFLFESHDLDSTQTVMDVFEVSFCGEKGFLGTTQLFASLRDRMCRVRPHVAQAVFANNFQALDRFFDRDCFWLAKAKFQIDWNVQCFWTFVWKFVVKQTSVPIAEMTLYWNRKALEQYIETTRISRPLLLLVAGLPYLKNQSFTIQNSLYGAASFDDFEFRGEHETILQFMGMETVLDRIRKSASAVLIQLGDWFPETEQLNNYLVYGAQDEEKLLLYDLYREVGWNSAVPLFKKVAKTCKTFNAHEEDKIKNHLRENRHDNVLFFESPSSGTVKAICLELDFVLGLALEMQFCWRHSVSSIGVKAEPSYWMVPFELSELAQIVITNDNMQALLKPSNTNRHFFLLKLKREPIPLTIVNNYECDETKLHVLYGIVPIYLTRDPKDTETEAIQTIWQRFYHSIDRDQYQLGPNLERHRIAMQNEQNFAQTPKSVRSQPLPPPEMRSPVRIIRTPRNEERGAAVPPLQTQSPTPKQKGPPTTQTKQDIRFQTPQPPRKARPASNPKDPNETETDEDSEEEENRFRREQAQPDEEEEEEEEEEDEF